MTPGCAATRAAARRRTGGVVSVDVDVVQGITDDVVKAFGRLPQLQRSLRPLTPRHCGHPKVYRREG